MVLLVLQIHIKEVRVWCDMITMVEAIEGVRSFCIRLNIDYLCISLDKYKNTFSIYIVLLCD